MNKSQAKQAKELLNGLENSTLNGVETNTYKDVELLKSNYSASIFLRYKKLEQTESSAGWSINHVEITKSGKIIRNPEMKPQFKTLADRVSFFNSLYPISL